MTSPLSESYSHCKSLARNSGSSFYRSFSLLGLHRRNAMMALYAFARLADDATDGQESFLDTREAEASRWCAKHWHDWIDALPASSIDFHASHSTTECLEPIRLALSDSIERFAIPRETLHDLVRGVDIDCQQTQNAIGDTVAGRLPPAIRMKNWAETKAYCHLVASSVGIACLSIWARKQGELPSDEIRQAALDCGIAFQMTNILRDIGEDARRNRIYLPEEELARFGIDTARWLALPNSPTIFALNEVGDWRGLIRLQMERTKALYDRGWAVANAISLDGKRMFSLMWNSYRALLESIDEKPELIWQSRVHLTRFTKIKLVAQHLCTPLFQRLPQPAQAAVGTKGSAREWPEHGPRVAVIGAGLAGINASLHLARHGCRVTLLESKHRIGGRVGSFVDSETGQPVDYCQHVGMNCCSTLKRWIEDTHQTPNWIEQDTLHFVSAQGKKVRVAAWPLPAPFHLAGLLFRWPQLRLTDRFRVGIALLRLMRLNRNQNTMTQLAIEWLRANGQSDRCIQNFWATILVSALGEQVDRVTLRATHKVLIDGFAKERTAFHLLVPSRPLSELLDRKVAPQLRHLGVEVRLGAIVKEIVYQSNGLLMVKKPYGESIDERGYDAIVVALPWNKLAEILDRRLLPAVESANALKSSPITGIHTWWDRPWLTEPHAILINRFSQWVFPAPISTEASDVPQKPNQTKEYYYQVVVSGSRDLPQGDANQVLRMVKEDLAEIFPESAVATLLRGRVVTDPNAVFSVSVGHESSRLPCNQLASERIWLAGDWTDTQWPATMEGALKSGAIAAEQVLQAFGHDAYLLQERERG